jgi:cysteine desulfurase
MHRPSEATRSIYLDWNATTPPHPDVVDAMRAAIGESWANPSSVHSAGRKARAVVEDAREEVARLCGVEARAVILTSGATEANNLALRHATALVTSRLEHPSVVRVAERLVEEARVVRWLPVPPSGHIEPAAVRDALDGLSPGFFVALTAVNHETGVIQPVEAVAEVVRARGGRLHVDAVQALGKIGASALRHFDTLSLSAHKICGPKGIGALVLGTPGLPQPVLLGGSQERGIRPGTVDPVAAAGFAVAARRAHADGPERYSRLAVLRDRFEAAAAGHGAVNGGEVPRAPHVTNLSIDGWRGDELVAALDLCGVHIASGSACSAGTSEPSPVITAMLGRERAASAIRVSLGESTTAEDVEFAISSLHRVVRRDASIP